jgi:histidinol-phosphate/aromatic aminotransferase/cobyric acid decarboxylase-like protein/choline kinase
MQAVILAAGMGNRLGKYTKNNTKCMLPINGRTLIERALDALDQGGIRKCVIVAGYQKDNLMGFIGARYKQVAVTYVSNDIYHKTNNIYSLYLAKNHLEQDDTLLLESDLIFENALITDVLNNPEPTLAVVAPYEAWMDGTMALVSKENLVTQLIPRRLFDYQQKDSYYKTVNIYKFSKTFLRQVYIPFLEAYTKAMGTNEYYEQVLRVIATLDKHDLKALIIKNRKWYEIDDVQDKDIAETLFTDAPEEKLPRIAKRYGGYWRFPSMLDFCYLVNPYFPTAQMHNEMRACFQDLTAMYPSGLDVQNLLAGKLFEVEPEHILTGNGAAELIRGLGEVVQGRAGIIYPSFNEYPETLAACASIVPLYPENPASYTAEQVIQWFDLCDTLVLINPDNPSGSYITMKDLRGVLEYMRRQGKRLILDESFVDFADSEGGGQAGILRQDILDAFPRLIVIKSLSKSYGIAGLRLGVLACGEQDTIQRIRKSLPIWNINSFAEYFLQIIGKYQKDYRLSCRRIAEERRRFKAELEGTGLLEAHPSQGNYLLCQCAEGHTAAKLAEYLLDSHGLFIKDLTGKNGLSGSRWIRLAVRNQADNNALLAALRQYAVKAR